MDDSEVHAGTTRALDALAEAKVAHEVHRHGRVDSLEEAARVRGIDPRQILKTIVVRRADDDFLFVLVPGDRQISWPKLRALLAVSRLSMPDAALAREVTGYERGTITPFGATRAWPVIADSLAILRGETVSIGGGAHGVSVTLNPEDLVFALGARVADVTDPV